MRLIDFFDRGVSLGSEKVCLQSDTRILTYGDVQASTYRIANALHAAGIARGATAAVLSPNDIDAFVCILAILRAGATWMPLNAKNPTSENSALIERFRCEWLFYHSSFASDVETIVRQAPNLRGAVCIDQCDGKNQALADWCGTASASLPVVHWDFDDVSCLFLTGGTTGRSKGIMLTHRSLSTMVANTICAMPYEEAPRYLMAAPMTHAAGCFGLSFLPYGSTNVFLPRPDPQLVMSAIESHRITTLFLPPTVIYMLLARPDVRDHDYSSLKHLIYGAAPMSLEKLRQALEVFGPVMAEIYGQSESPAPCAFMSPQEHVACLSDGKRHRLLSCGRPTVFTQLAIMDDAGNIVQSGELGEIVIRGQHVMRGYFGDPAATREVSTHGWHHTGDIGHQDADGYVYVVDRKKEMIISGGFNIFPAEVEQVILEHPSVQDCAVVGVPDDKWGEAVLAVLEVRAGVSIDMDELKTFCRTRLGGIKAPKAYEIWPEIPRSAVGKVSRRSIRDRYWTDRQRRI